MATFTLPRAGEYNQRVLLRLWSDTGNLGFGLDQNFDAGLERWAKYEPIFGLAMKADAQTGEAPTDMFYLRYATGTRPQDVSTAHVIEHDGQRFRVLNAIDLNGAQTCVRVTCKNLGVM